MRLVEAVLVSKDKEIVIDKLILVLASKGPSVFSHVGGRLRQSVQLPKLKSVLRIGGVGLRSCRMIGTRVKVSLCLKVDGKKNSPVRK